MTIIVSAFISNVNKQKSISQYIEYGKYLLSDDISNFKIIFIERKIYNEYFHKNNNFCIFNYEEKNYEYTIQANIIFVFFEKQDIYIYNYNDEIINFNVNTDNPSKDTLEYMFIQCHKTEWMKMAIQLTFHIKHENTVLKFNEISKFMWVDFGIYHVFNNTELFYNAFKNLNKIYTIDRVRIGSCIHPNNKYHTDIYKNIAWYFAGGVFGGSSDVLMRFSQLMKEECVNIIKERKHLMWEVNVWYLIYLKEPELFDTYICNHNESIISNF